MSLLGQGNVILVKAFASVLAVLNLPEIQHGPTSVSNVSFRHESIRSGVDLAEGCILTKPVKYAQKFSRIINAVRSEDTEPIEEVLELDMKIIPYENFTLNDACNFAFRISEGQEPARLI